MQEGSKPASGSCHHPDCPRLDIETLKRSWWETVSCNAAAEEDSQWLVGPPMTFAEGIEPSPVLLYLCGDGSVDNRQDFLSANVDLLLQNDALRRSCIIIAPLPTTTSGLLRSNQSGFHRRAWDEEAVWAAFTEVIRRLGSAWVDPARLCATGISLGAAGVWHLALRFGDMLAAVAPIAGRCEWPDDSWPWDSFTPCEEVAARLRRL